MTAAGGPPARARREPPAFRRATVAAVRSIGPRLREVRLRGTPLVGFPVPLPAASVRLLLPIPGATELALPGWNGNEFLLPDGRRPVLRTVTPRRVDPVEGTLDIEVVVHGGGPLSAWAASRATGAQAAISGPGRGYVIDRAAKAFLLGGDETALPAIATLLEAMPPDVSVQVHVEVGSPEGRVPMPCPAGVTAHWYVLDRGAAPGEALVQAVRDATIPDEARVWIAGEAAAVQRIRRHLFDERGLPRTLTTVRGYWKHGRGGDLDDG